MVKQYIDDECEWINDEVCCKKCKEPVHIVFFHDGPVSTCPKCNKIYEYPYLGELTKWAHLKGDEPKMVEKVEIPLRSWMMICPEFCKYIKCPKYKECWGVNQKW